MSNQAGIRETYLRFPGWSQPFWTWYTGKALSGQHPVLRLDWRAYLSLTCCTFLAGLLLSALALSGTTGWLWLPLALGLALTIWASRSMIIVVAHQCIHRRFSRSPRMDEAIGELVTVLTMFQTLRAFKLEHIDSHHQPATFATREDPPVQVLESLGFRAGIARAQLWRQAWWVFFTPGLYVKGAWSRIHDNLTAGTIIRRIGFLGWAGLWLSMPFWIPNGTMILLVGFVLPVILAAQLSALLDKMGEHGWLTPPNPAHGRRHHHVSASWARFCGDPVPHAGMPVTEALMAWAIWLTRMLFYHLPVRLFVIVGDLPNHDYHHRFPGRRDWLTAAYGRQREVDLGNGPPYAEIWGLGAAIDRSFSSLAEHGRTPMPAGGPETLAQPSSA